MKEKTLRKDFENSNSMVTPLTKAKENGATTKARRIPTPLSKRLYTLKEAAEYLGRTEWNMRDLIWAGSIAVVTGLCRAAA